MTDKFDGDGRTVIRASKPYPIGTKPMAVKRSAARMLVWSFLKAQTSMHSARGATVWVLAKRWHPSEAF